MKKRSLDINKEPSTPDEIDKAVSSIKNGKAVGLDEILAAVLKLEAFKVILLHFCNSVYNQDPIQRWNEGVLLPFPKKRNLANTENYREVTFTPIAAKIYNLLTLHRMRPKIDRITRDTKISKIHRSVL